MGGEGILYLLIFGRHEGSQTSRGQTPPWIRERADTFSHASLQTGHRGPRSGLVWAALDLLAHGGQSTPTHALWWK